jgi:hypothetical protein
MVWMLAWMACDPCPETPVGENGDTADTGDTGDTGETQDTGKAPSLRADQIWVDLAVQAPAEGAWDVDLSLQSDGVFADRVARVALEIERVSAKETVSLSLSPAGVQDLFVGTVGAKVPDEGFVLEPLVVEGQVHTLRADPEVSDVDYEEVEDARLPMIGSWDLPEAYNSPTVFGAVDASSGELLLRTSSMGDAAHYPVGGFTLVDTQGLALHTQAQGWRAGKDAPSGPLERGEELVLTLELFDAGGDPVGSVSRTAMYGDILMYQVPLDDFYD